MATCRTQLFLTLIYKTSKNNVLLASGNTFRSHVPPVCHCSTTEVAGKAKVSKAMKSYLQKKLEYDMFIKEQLKEFEMGKKFLASMMGKKGEMTQQEVDEAIEYLFPSGLFVPKARPMMKRPEDVFPRRETIPFDDTGRPFNFLFYTARQNYSNILHEAASHLKKLNDHQDKLKKSGQVEPIKKLVLVGHWFSKEDLEKKILEKIYTIEYSKFLEVLNRLSEHPYAYMVEDFIMQYWNAAVIQKDSEISPPVQAEDGTQTMTSCLATRKTSTADVKLIYPGTGRIQINNLGLDYFFNMQSREQVNIAHPFTSRMNTILKEKCARSFG